MRKSRFSRFLTILFILVLAGALLIIINYYNNSTNQSQESIESTRSLLTSSQEDEALSETLETEMSSIEEDVRSTAEETEEVVESGPLFDESVLGDSDFPPSSIPNDVNKADLQTAMDEYYATQYTAQEKTNTQSRISDEQLTAIQTTIDNNEALAPLNASVDQIQMSLDNDTVYVARIIVPLTYTQANNTAENNDIDFLTIALTELGNRLVMITYYNENSQELIPYHLTNSTKPIFTYTNN
ncbi:hypothetical protein [Fundicoccus culcitae]|uniref:Uncharacterized protein n=1 Tax=Fundicoccus culcitae TaxID=2969821 RepID=A0ABY5P3E0_9LACT|nr:hypothetical protein [Fundicoccus culcitae]UUX32973.1 hypothetical protein NRE15_08590 [Fundicoccus culcitae]